MKTNKLILAAAIAAAVTQVVNAVPLVTVLGSSSIKSEVKNGLPASNTTQAITTVNSSGGTSKGLAGTTTAASTSWSLTDNGSSATLSIASSIHLGNASTYAENFLDFRFHLDVPAVYTMSGNLGWQQNDLFVEALQQGAYLRLGLPPVPTYSWRETDFLPSNRANGFSLDNVNQAGAAGGDLPLGLSPFWNVSTGVDPLTFELAPGDYQLRWNNRIQEGGPQGLGSNGTSDFQADGTLNFTLRALVDQRVPEAGATVMMLGAGVIGLALAGRKVGQKAA